MMDGLPQVGPTYEAEPQDRVAHVNSVNTIEESAAVPANHDAQRRATTVAGLILAAGRRTERIDDANWEPKDFSDTTTYMNYVPMNSAGRAHSLPFGTYLATGSLNSCTAVAAAYREESNTASVFLSHYDPEHIRDVADNGRLKVSGLLTAFAGKQAVDVVVAYPQNLTIPHLGGESRDPAEFPTGAIIEDALTLPKGSHVLLIPYKSQTYSAMHGRVAQAKRLVPGHTLHVGQGATGRIEFGWDGHPVQVGETEVYDEQRERAARLFIAQITEELEQDMTLYGE